MASADGLECGEEFVFRDTEFLENFGGSGVGLFFEGGKKEVFDTDVFVFEF